MTVPNIDIQEVDSDEDISSLPVVSSKDQPPKKPKSFDATRINPASDSGNSGGRVSGNSGAAGPAEMKDAVPPSFPGYGKIDPNIANKDDPKQQAMDRDNALESITNVNPMTGAREGPTKPEGSFFVNGWLDPNVQSYVDAAKQLREFAWKVQNRHHKPNCVLPEDFKRMAYNRASRVVTYTMDVPRYVGEHDFRERAPKMRNELEGILVELEKLEAQSIRDRTGKAWKPHVEYDADGNVVKRGYKITSVEDFQCDTKPVVKSNDFVVERIEDVTDAEETAAEAGESNVDETTAEETENPAKPLNLDDIDDDDDTQESKGQSTSASSSEPLTKSIIQSTIDNNNLDLSGYPLNTDADVDAVIAALRDCMFITTLTLKGTNKISDGAMQRLIVLFALPSNLPQLEKVTFCGFKDGPKNNFLKGLKMMRKKVDIGID